MYGRKPCPGGSLIPIVSAARLQQWQSFVEKRLHSSAEDRVSLLAFDTQVQKGPLLLPIGDFNDTWLRTLRPGSQTCFETAISAIIPHVAQTPTGHRCLIVLLSDGWAHFPASSLGRLFARRSSTQALRLHTIQFPPGDAQGKFVLTQIVATAKQSAGQDDFASKSSYMESVDGITLQEAFMGIAESLSSAAGGLISG